MRVSLIATFVVICGAASFAQAPAPAPTDRTRATHFSAADLQSALAKLPADRPAGSVRVFSLDPYNVAVEQRQPRAQGASLHEAQAELFFVIDGSATMITGGTIAEASATVPTSRARPSKAALASPSTRATSSWCRRECRISSSTSRRRCG